MSSLIIHGGKPLCGTVRVSGSKNAVLGIIAAAMMLDGPCTLENVPDISDVRVLLEICEDFGAQVQRLERHKIVIDPRTVRLQEARAENTRRIRASYYLLGALLGRFGEVSMSLPGGCNFGTRPIDLHLKGFQAMGSQVEKGGGGIRLYSKGRLRGARVFLDTVSVGATINLMLAGTRAEGVTIIENAAKEPHIVDVANFLNTMGADIKGAGTDVIRIHGVARLEGGKCYSAIPDQIEAGTYMLMAAATRGDVTVSNIIPKHMEVLVAKLEEMGVHCEAGEDSYRVYCLPGERLHCANFKTLPYPGFPTDLQPQTTAMLVTVEGLSRVFEGVWENRFQYVEELKLMGADIQIAGKYALINGPVQMSGGRVQARDLRAGAAMVLAGLVAEGETEILEAQYVERGYEDIINKLTALGADIWKAD